MKEAGLLSYTYPKDRSKQMVSKVRYLLFLKDYHLKNKLSVYNDTLYVHKIDPIRNRIRQKFFYLGP